MVLMITYDLNKPGQDYDALFKKIKELGSTWCHPLNNVWFIVTGLSPPDVVDSIKPVIDATDELLVVRATSPGAWLGLGNEASDWLKKYL